MSSTINATTVGVGGVVTTADNSGILVLQTASTDAVTISAAQGVTLAGTLGVTGITTVAAGTALLPALTTTGDTNTGFWFPAADTIAASTGGTERIRVTSGGLFGIACTPARQLSVQYPFAKTDTTSRPIAVFKSNDASNANEMLFSSVGAATQASRVWKIQTGEDNVSNAGSISLQPDGGNVGIGTTSVSYKLHVRTSAVTGLAGFTYTPQIVTESNATGGFGMHTPTANQGVIAHSTPLDQTSAAIHFDGASRYISFATVNDTERMRIDSSGRLLIGTTSTIATGPSTIEIASTVYMTTWRCNGAAAGKYWQWYVDSSNKVVLNNNGSAGVQLTDGATSWSALSDETEKDIIEPITNGLEKIVSLRSVIGKYKTDEISKRRSFLIAQDVEKVLPEAVDVTINMETELPSLILRYTDIIPLLVSAIKDLKTITETQSARITALETL